MTIRMEGFVGSTRAIVVCDECFPGEGDLLIDSSPSSIERVAKVHAASTHRLFGEVTIIVNRDDIDDTWLIFVTEAKAA